MFDTKYVYKNSYTFFMITVLLAVFLNLQGSTVSAGISAVVGGALFAVLFLSDFNKKLLITAPFITTLAVFLLTDDFFMAVLSFGYFPLALMLVYCVSKRKNMSQTVVSVAVLLFAFYVIIYAIHIVYHFGALNIDSIKKYIGLFLTNLTYVFKTYNNSNVTADGKTLFTDEQIVMMIDIIKYLFVGFYFSALMLAGFFSALIYKASLKNIISDDEDIFNVRKWRFTLSKQAAVIYIFLYFIFYLTSGLPPYRFYLESGLPPYMELSLFALFIPIQMGLLYMGGGVFWIKFKSGRISVFMIIGMIIISNIIFGSLFDMLVFVITIFGLISVLKSKRAQDNNQL